MTTATLAVLAAIALGTAAPASPGAVSLEKTPWKAIELGGRPVPPARPGREPALVFDARGRVTGADGCSRVAGPYQMMGPIIKFGRLAEAQSACTGGRDAVRAFRSALATAHVWRIKEGRLEFRDSSGVLVARFESPSARASARGVTSTALAHTAWRLLAFQGGDVGRIADRAGTNILEFGDRGTLAARLDCQRGRGTWKASGRGDLQLGRLALKPAHCSSNGLHDRLASDWTSVQSYSLRNGHLFLSLMGERGVYEFAPLKP